MALKVYYHVAAVSLVQFYTWKIRKNLKGRNITHTLREPRYVYARRGATAVALPLPHDTQKVIQGGAVPLEAYTGEQARLNRPNILESARNVVRTYVFELGTRAVVNALALDGGTTDESGSSSKDRDKGGGGEEHWYVMELSVYERGLSQEQVLEKSVCDSLRDKETEAHKQAVFIRIP